MRYKPADIAVLIRAAVDELNGMVAIANDHGLRVTYTAAGSMVRDLHIVQPGNARVEEVVL